MHDDVAGIIRQALPELLRHVQVDVPLALHDEP
jgi:hypothetical protein